jgi:uncharacterized CHY-type Zn-finger protein
VTTAIPESPAIICGRCKWPLSSEVFNVPGMTVCPNCGTPTRVLAFPALNRRRGNLGLSEDVIVDGDAGCFFHPAKKAVVGCANCGRFICGLCDLELNGQHLCPNCLESGKQKGRLSEIDSRRTVYSGLALTLALVSCIIGPLALITAPITLFIVIRHWKTPGSLVGGSGNVSRVVAAILAVLQLIGWIVWIIVLAR